MRGTSSDLHLFRVGDCCLAFDVNSGSLHRLDEVAWEILRHVAGGRSWEAAEREAAERFPLQEVEEASRELRELQERGELLTADPGWEEFAPGNELGLKALCLNIAHSCNLSCSYCFVPGDVRSEGALMPLEVIRGALDLLIQESPYEFVTVDFFGGEPLLNFEGIRFAVEYARERGREKRWKFTLTTNATLLDDAVLAFCREHGISLVLSCDGRPEVHDRHRLTRGGRGTSSLVEKRLRRFFETGACGEYYVRGTYTRFNLDFAEDVKHLAGLGARSVSLEPVVAPEDEPYALRFEDLDRIRDEYLRLARLLLELEEKGTPVTFYHFAIDLSGGPCAAKRMTGCGAGYQYLAVAPGGEIYPCHQFVGNREYLLGNVREGITNRELRERFLGAHIYRKEPCRSCWARFLCGGGCHAQAALLEGDILRPHRLSCELMRMRLEAALYYIAQRLR
ncbi:MAG: thioether cross-link-forming SCIFF peptide maturase [Thermacetogeniaceae bacterium]